MTEQLPSAEIVVCPECGAAATAALNRRDAKDFCANCDYPLFWTPSDVIMDRGDGSDESLRRLPGTVGRATIASLPCPACAEPNAVSALTCVRCGASLHPVEAPPPPPEPEPVYVPPPPLPEPVVYEDHRTPWRVWAFLVISLTLIVVLTTMTVRA